MEFLGYCPIHYAENFGELLLLHRTHRGLSHRNLGKILNVDPAAISRWESKGRYPYKKWENLLKKYFNIPDDVAASII